MSIFAQQFLRLARQIVVDEEGATAIEYGLLAALLGTALITSLNALGGQLKTTFSTTSSAMSSANAAA